MNIQQFVITVLAASLKALARSSVTMNFTLFSGPMQGGVVIPKINFALVFFILVTILSRLAAYDSGVAFTSCDQPYQSQSPKLK